VPSGRMIHYGLILGVISYTLLVAHATAEPHQRHLKVTTSTDRDSNAAQSFIVVPAGKIIPEGITKDSNTKNLALQIPFIVQLSEKPDDDTLLQWTVSTSSKYYGGINLLSKFKGTKTKSQTTYTWQSRMLEPSIFERHILVFNPQSINHDTSVYKKGKGRNNKRQRYGGGTRLIDDKKYNPRLSYDVTLDIIKNKKTINSFNTIIRMDNKDMIRQEYINHYEITRYGLGENGNLPIPKRSEISEPPAKSDKILGNALTESEYGLLINDGISKLTIKIVNAYEAKKAFYKKNKLVNLDNKRLEIPDSQLWLSGGWRNPERNEWYSNALNGIHQRGGAVDIIINEPPGHINASIGYWILWQALEDNKNAIDGFWQLETNGRPMRTDEFRIDIEPQNGIPDAFDKADHLHANIKYTTP